MNDDSSPSKANPDTSEWLSDTALARRARTLGDIHPERDLWRGIERQILDHPQKTAVGSGAWMPYATAASLLMAASALIISLVQPGERPGVDPQLAALGAIQQDYLRVRNPMVEQFGMVNRRLDDKTRSALFENLEIIAQARREITLELRENPQNDRLREMLLRLHEQELALLRKDFTAPLSVPATGHEI